MYKIPLRVVFWLVASLICTHVISQETVAQYQLIERDHHRIHLLEVDPTHYQIIAVKAHHDGMQRETVTSLVKRYEAYAGINGGFFHDGEWDGLPAGVLKIKGEWVGLPALPRAALGWSSQGEALVDRLLAKGTVEIKGEKYPIQKLNVPLTTSQCVLYTPIFSQTPLLPPQMTELIFDQHKLIQNTKQGFNVIPPQGWAYRCSSKQTSDLALNEPGKYQITIWPQLDKSSQARMKWQAFDYIVGGAPLLIKNRQIMTNYQIEKVKNSFLMQPHARTAVCIKPNGHWLFLVAEHTPKIEIPFTHISQGLTIPELRDFLFSLKCKEAINLDGGGSSTLVIKNKMLNALQVGDEESFLDLYYERPVSDAILLLPR